MSSKKSSESSRSEEHDSVAEQLIKNDEIIKKISSKVGINAIEITQNQYARVMIIHTPMRNGKNQKIRVVLSDCSTPVEVMNVVRSTLLKLVKRPFPLDVLINCESDLSDDANGDEETHGATEEQLLRKIAQKEGGKALMHAQYIYAEAMEHPNPFQLENELRKILDIEKRITNRCEAGDQLCAYWWIIDNYHTSLHVVYVSPDQVPATDRENERVSYPVLTEEIYTALEEMGINTIVKITNDDDEKNGALLTSTDDETIYDTPFGSAPPILTTNVNGIVMDRVVLQTFINQIRDVLEWQKANGRQHGVNITIGDYILNESEDGDLNTCVHLDWHLKCYEQLPNISTELLEEEKSDILDCLLKDEELFEKIGIDILRAIKRSDTTTVRASQREIQYVEITWSLMHHYCTETEEIEELSRVLRSIHRESDETNLRIAILESFNIEETEDCIILRLGITVSDDAHE